MGYDRGKIKITDDWSVLEPMEWCHHDGDYKRNGMYQETTYVGVYGRLFAGHLEIRIDSKTVNNWDPAVLPVRSSRVTQTIPANNGDHVGRKDGGVYEIRPAGQYHIAVIAVPQCCQEPCV